MSLQVCHCGWSKVTSVHGLRTHQGIKGCTPKGVKIAQSDQQYLQDFVGAPAIHLDVKLRVQTSIKTDTTDYYSDLSLQVCHCGWSRMTTYQGLRIHQGKMGCTLKGMRIPREEQYKWNKQQEADVDCRKPAERVVVKKESLSPRRRRSNNSAATTVQEGYMPPSAAARRSPQRSSKSDQQQFSSLHQVNRPVREHLTPTYPERNKKIKRQLSRNADSRAGEYCSIDRSTGYAATVKEEPKSPFAVSQPLFQRDTKSGQKLQDFSTDVQMNRYVKEPPTLEAVVRPKQKHREGRASSRVNRQLVREHPASMYQENVVLPKEEKLQNQLLSQNTDRAVEEYWSVKSSSRNATTAAALKEEPKLSPRPSLRRATKSSHQMQDSFTDVKVNKKVRELPNAPPLVPAVPPTENSRKDPTPSEVNRSVRENSRTPPPVLSKKKDALLFKVRQEKIKPELQQKLQKTEEKLTGIRTAEPVCESVDSATNTQTAPAAEVSATEDPASLNEAAQPGFSTGMTVKELARMFSATTDQEPKNEGGEQKPSQVKLLAREFSASTEREAVVQSKEKDKKKQGVEEGKFLAPEFLASTARETAVQPQENDNEEQKLSENEPPSINSATAAKVLEEPKQSVTTQSSLKKVSDTQGDLQLQVNTVRKHPTTPPPVLPKNNILLVKVKEGTFKSELQQKHPEEKTADIKPAETVHEKVADTANTNTQVSAKEDPPSLNEAAQPDFSTGMKVKELAQMFSATTNQEPKNDKVEQNPSQTKLLAQRFSAVTANKTALQPKGKDKTQAKLLAPRFSASTVRETVGQPKNNDGEKHKLSQKQLPNSTNVATRMNPEAAAEATMEKDPKSSCETAQLSDVCASVKVKDLIRMFSATATQETDVQTKGKKREQNLPKW
ncbi:uncharacterized protein LOC110967944 [Acanthochromis polyacanthus]|uniref:uncharacterized protein LOC110967944 n=1 Tax=Acanthochromis polyacanthus TaxID=80966 RepID=UPI002234AF9D|nr:uncharacterized protein LOC110967944 [Acanthochromis polyacanthus]